MGIKEIWSTSLQLHRKSLSETWYLGIVIGTIVITLLFVTNAHYNINGTTFKAIDVVVALFASLLIMYLSSLMFLKIHSINTGQNISWKDSLIFVNKRYLKVTIAMLIVFVMIFLGTFALFLPGVFAFVLLFLTQPLVLLDDKGIIGSIKGSCKLVWGKWWHTFAAMIPLVFINYWIVFSISYAITYSKWSMVICSGLVAMLFYPLLCSFILVMFDDLKSHKINNSAT